MKRYIYFAAALLMLASCAKEKDVKPERTDITVNADLSGTKTAVSYAEGLYSFTWQAGDAIVLYEYVAETRAIDARPSDQLQAPSATGSFSVRNLSLTKETEQAFHYVAVYPASSGATVDPDEWYGSGTDACPVIRVTIPSQQHLPSLGTFDPAADVMVSLPEACMERPETFSAAFSRVGGLLKIHFTGLPTEGSSICLANGSLSVDENACQLAGTYRYIPEEHALDLVPATEGGASAIFFTGGTNCPVVGGEADVYLRCGSGDITGTVTVDLNVDVDGTNHEFIKRFFLSGQPGEFIPVHNGEITLVTVAMEEVLPYAYSFTDINVTPSEEGCHISGTVTSTQGIDPSGLTIELGYTVNEQTIPSEVFNDYMVNTEYASVGRGGSFSFDIDCLSPGTTYYCCFRISDRETGDSYSGIGTFTTEGRGGGRR